MSKNVCPCCITINDSQVGLVQWFGKHTCITTSGLKFVLWPFQTVIPVSTRLNIYDCKTDTKTKDNIYVDVTTTVQFSVDPQRANAFYYKMTAPTRHIEAYVDNMVRSFVTKMDLDAAYAAKDDLAKRMQETMANHLQPYGLIVHSCLMTDLKPEAHVVAAMNEMSTAARRRTAAAEKAESDKFAVIKLAEAEAEAKFLSGMGAAKMRQAVADGFHKAVNTMKAACPNMAEAEVVQALLSTQHMEVLSGFAAGGNTAIVVPSETPAVHVQFKPKRV